MPDGPAQSVATSHMQAEGIKDRPRPVPAPLILWPNAATVGLAALAVRLAR